MQKVYGNKVTRKLAYVLYSLMTDNQITSLFHQLFKNTFLSILKQSVMVSLSKATFFQLGYFVLTLNKFIHLYPTPSSSLLNCKTVTHLLPFKMILILEPKNIKHICLCLTYPLNYWWHLNCALGVHSVHKLSSKNPRNKEYVCIAQSLLTQRYCPLEKIKSYTTSNFIYFYSYFIIEVKDISKQCSGNLRTPISDSHRSLLAELRKLPGSEYQT